jgi:hypothetical protein
MPRPPARRRLRGVMVRLQPSWHADLERKRLPPPCDDKTELARAMRGLARALLAFAEKLNP